MPIGSLYLLVSGPFIYFEDTVTVICSGLLKAPEFFP